MAEIIKQGECLQDESTMGQGFEMHYTLTDDCPCLSSIDPGKFAKVEDKTDGDDDLPF